MTHTLCMSRASANSDICFPWWRHQMETFSALLDICAGNSPVPVNSPHKRPATRSFDVFYVFFDLRLNKRLRKQPWGWWFETLSRPLWHHRNALCHYRAACSVLDRCMIILDRISIPSFYVTIQVMKKHTYDLVHNMKIWEKREPGWKITRQSRRRIFCSRGGGVYLNKTIWLLIRQDTYQISALPDKIRTEQFINLISESF